MFGDSSILLIEYTKKGQRISVASYATTLCNLREAIKKRRGKLSAGVFLRHDNAFVHTTRVAKNAMHDCGFEEINHPPHSPHLTLRSS